MSYYKYNDDDDNDDSDDEYEWHEDEKCPSESEAFLKGNDDDIQIVINKLSNLILMLSEVKKEEYESHKILYFVLDDINSCITKAEKTLKYFKVEK